MRCYLRLRRHLAGLLLEQEPEQATTLLRRQPPQPPHVTVVRDRGRNPPASARG